MQNEHRKADTCPHVPKCYVFEWNVIIPHPLRVAHVLVVEGKSHPSIGPRFRAPAVRSAHIVRPSSRRKFLAQPLQMPLRPCPSSKDEHILAERAQIGNVKLPLTR